MPKEISDKSVWLIFFEGLKIYSMNFHKFFLYMLFPIFGQILGLFLIFGLVFWYSENLPQLISKYGILDNFSTIALSIVLVVLPGLIIFTKAVWEYLIAYGALNSMTEGAITTGRVYDFPAHKATVKQHLLTYIGIWFLVSIFLIFATIPIFWLLWILFIYFILVFQVFTFEPELSPIGCLKRSFELVKGKFGRTFLLMSLVGILSYYILSAGLSVIFDAIKLSDILTGMFESWSMNLPIEYINKFYEPFTKTTLSPLIVSKMFLSQFVLFIAGGFTLPLRSICWTLWYKNNNNGKLPLTTKPKKVRVSREVKPSKRNTKNSKTTSFKIEKREIDPEIIRRARLEDDEY